MNDQLPSFGSCGIDQPKDPGAMDITEYDTRWDEALEDKNTVQAIFEAMTDLTEAQQAEIVLVLFRCGGGHKDFTEAGRLFYRHAVKRVEKIISKRIADTVF